MKALMYPSLAVRAREWFRLRRDERIVWCTSQCLDLRGEASDAFAWVAVIGREHYEQTRQRYPIRGWWDLQRVLQIESGGDQNQLAVIGPLEGDDREVTVFRLLPSAPLPLFNALVWIPETLLLTPAARRHGVVTVDREGLKYFLASSGDTLIAGGAIRSPELFAMAAGVAATSDDVRLGASEVISEISSTLSTLPLSTWWSLRSRVAVRQLTRFLQPAITFAALGFLVYLVLVSLYLTGASALRERQLAALGPETTTLIAEQRAVDIMAKELAGMGAVVTSAEPAWPIWEVFAAVWRVKGAIYSISVVDDVITLRCTAPAATDALESLRSLKGFTDARFDSAVRQGGIGQEFVISLKRVATTAVGS